MTGSATLTDEMLEDTFLQCEKCAGETGLFVTGDGQLICLECAGGKMEAA